MRRHAATLLPSVLLAVLLTGCLGTVVGTSADVAIEVVKVPFKVVGAAADLATGEDTEDE